MHQTCTILLSLVLVYVYSLKLNCGDHHFEYGCCELFNLQISYTHSSKAKTLDRVQIDLISGTSIKVRLKDKSISREHLSTLDHGAVISVYGGYEKWRDIRTESIRTIPLHSITNAYYEGKVFVVGRRGNIGQFSGNYRNGMLTGELRIGETKLAIVSNKRIQYLCLVGSELKRREKIKENKTDTHGNIKSSFRNHRVRVVRDIKYGHKNKRKGNTNSNFSMKLNLTESTYNSTMFVTESNSLNTSTTSFNISIGDSNSPIHNTSSPEYSSKPKYPSSFETTHSFAPTRSPNTQTTTPPVKNSNSKSKSSHSSSYSNEYRVCKLHFIVDVSFYEQRCLSSVSCCLAYVEYLVKYSDSKYRSVDFNYDGVSDNIGFVVQKIDIFTSKKSSNYTISDSINAQVLLEQFGYRDFAHTCLAILLLDRKLLNNTLGMSWVGDSRDSPGGICQKTKTPGSGVRNTTLISMNGLLVTSTDRRPLSAAIVAFSLSHEIGHSFGANHDSKYFCQKFNSERILTMSTVANSNKVFLLPDDKYFSKCSIARMSVIIKVKGGCIRPYQVVETEICGDFKVSEKEQCDCGPTPDHCDEIDICCTAPDVNQMGCKLKESKQCSPVKYKCCTSDCHVELSEIECQPETECKMASSCDSHNAKCPTPQNKPNGTVCDGEKKVCSNGLCSVDRCTYIGLKPCQCGECEYCCSPSKSLSTLAPQQCKPLLKYGVANSTIYRNENDLCQNNTGYCDQFHKCYVVHVTIHGQFLGRLLEPTNLKSYMSDVLNNWLIIGLIVGSLLLGYATFRLRYYVLKTPTIVAKRCAMLMAIWRQLGHRYIGYEQKVFQLQIEYEEQVKQLLSADRSITNTIARLMILFPETQVLMIQESVVKSSNEEMAVCDLLLRGEPLIVSQGLKPANNSSNRKKKNKKKNKRKSKQMNGRKNKTNRLLLDKGIPYGR